LKRIWISLNFAGVSTAPTGFDFSENLPSNYCFRTVYSGYCSIEVYVFHVGGNIFTKYNT
jgi:hypothetical protein